MILFFFLLSALFVAHVVVVQAVPYAATTALLLPVLVVLILVLILLVGRGVLLVGRQLVLASTLLAAWVPPVADHSQGKTTQQVGYKECHDDVLDLANPAVLGDDQIGVHPGVIAGEDAALGKVFVGEDGAVGTRRVTAGFDVDEDGQSMAHPQFVVIVDILRIVLIEGHVHVIDVDLIALIDIDGAAVLARGPRAVLHPIVVFRCDRHADYRHRVEVGHEGGYGGVQDPGDAEHEHEGGDARCRSQG